MTFQLWDIGAQRLIGAFDTESAALDAAYQALLASAPRTVAVRTVAGPAPSPAPAPARWRALARLALPLAALAARPFRARPRPVAVGPAA